jgi:hypothetical protein
MKNLFLILSCSMFCLTGCQKDICQRSAEAAEACGETFTESDMDACQDSLDGCNQADERLLSAYFDCLDDAALFECPSDEPVEADELEDSLYAILECTEDLGDLSSACLETFTETGGATTPAD